MDRGLESTMNPLNRTGDPSTQKEWHSTYRDMVDNMYRTSYQDMIHGREVSVKNDYPAGYGGHVPTLRHDVLFRNTEFDRMRLSLRKDQGRDVFPSFAEQNMGIPSYTKFPRGVNQAPTAGCGPDVLVKPPWALTLTLREPPTFRTSPPASARMNSARGMQRPSTTPLGSARSRVNQAAMQAGHLAFSMDRCDPVDGVAASDRPVTASVLQANLTTEKGAFTPRALPMLNEAEFRSPQARPQTRA